MTFFVRQQIHFEPTLFADFSQHCWMRFCKLHCNCQHFSKRTNCKLWIFLEKSNRKLFMKPPGFTGDIRSQIREVFVIPFFALLNFFPDNANFENFSSYTSIICRCFKVSLQMLKKNNKFFKGQFGLLQWPQCSYYNSRSIIGHICRYVFWWKQITAEPKFISVTTFQCGKWNIWGRAPSRLSTQKSPR